MQKSPNNSIDIILPVYNEEGNIQFILKDIINKLNENKISNYNIIIAEDGSTDNTKLILKDFIQNKKIKIITFKERLGYTKSILNAIKFSNNDLLIFLDSDGQHDVKDIIKFIKTYNDKPIVGFRKKRKDTFGRKLLHKFVRNIINIFIKLKVIDASCGVVMIENSLMKNITKNIGYTESCFWWEFSIILSRSNIDFIQKEVRHHKRDTGSGFFNFKDLIRLIFKEFYGISKLIFYLIKS